MVVRRGVRLAYARQSHELLPQGTVLDAFLAAFADVLAVRHALSEAQHAAASGTDAALARLSTLTDQYHLKGGDELERRVTMIAQHLGFSDARPGAPAGEPLRRRARAPPPGHRAGAGARPAPPRRATNHLDLDTIAWLERHLADLSCAMLVVSHDRAFLDNVCPITMELGRRSFRSYPLKYSDYSVAREEDLARERELVERQQDYIAKTEEFIRKNIAGQKTKQAQSRRKMLDKLDTKERPEDVWATAEKVAFRFAPAPRSGDIVLEAQGLRAERGGRTLFSGVDLLVRRGERIGVVGPTAPARARSSSSSPGRAAPRTRGASAAAPTSARATSTSTSARSTPARPPSRRSAASAAISTPTARGSTGPLPLLGRRPPPPGLRLLRRERSRLALAKLLLEPRNLLFLDEPTNHLDIPAAEILEEALAGFEGTAILVSHDRRFLEGVTTRVILVRDGEVEIYPRRLPRLRGHAGPPRRRRRRREGRRRGAGPASGDGVLAPEPPGPGPGPRQRASRAGPRGEAERLHPARERAAGRRGGGQAPRLRGRQGLARNLERKKKRVRSWESEIAAGEIELERRREELKQDPAGNWARLAELAKQEQVLAKRVEAAMTEWMTLSEELEAPLEARRPPPRGGAGGAGRAPLRRLLAPQDGRRHRPPSATARSPP